MNKLIYCFLDTNEILLAKVYEFEEFEPEKGRLESIYGIDILFDVDNESVIEYFIKKKLAIKVEDYISNIKTNIYIYISWFFRGNHSIPSDPFLP